MAGEMVKREAVCLAIRPWSRTSHIVTWLTGMGTLATLVKGAVRPKSQFLGQYDLNYTCEIVYYARSRGDLHALRECTPLNRRDDLRGDFRALALADYFRLLTAELAPNGGEAQTWFETLETALEGLARKNLPPIAALLKFELATLHLLGLDPEIEAESGVFTLRGERQLPISPEVAACIRNPEKEKNLQVLLDTERKISVFYAFHVDCALDARRAVLRLIS